MDDSDSKDIDEKVARCEFQLENLTEVELKLLLGQPLIAVAHF